MFERYSRVKFLKSSPETFIVWNVRDGVAELLSQNNSDMFESLEKPFSIKRMNLSNLSLERNCYPCEDLRIACEMVIHARTWHDHFIARRDVFSIFKRLKKKDAELGDWFWKRGYIIGNEISLNVAEFFRKSSFISVEEIRKYKITKEELIYAVNGVTSAKNYYKELCME